MDLDKINEFRAKQAEEAQTQKQDGQHQELTSSLNNLLLATMVSKDPKMVEVAENLANLLNSIGQAAASFEGSNLQILPFANQELANSVYELSSRIQEYSPHDLEPYFVTLTRQLNMIAGNPPVVNVPTQPVSVDLKPLTKALDEVKKEIKANKIDIPKNDVSEVVKGLKAVEKTIGGLRFPVPNYVLPFKNSQGAATQVQLTADGSLPVAATIDTSAISTSANQTNGSQKTQIVDSGGEAATITDGKLDVNASIDTTGLATTLTDTNTTAIKTAVEILDNTVSGNEMQVDVVGALPAGTNNIGDVDIASIAAGDNNIGNVDVLSVIPGVTATSLGKAEDAAHASGDTGVFVLGVRQDADTSPVADGDYHGLLFNAIGRLKVSSLPAATTATVDNITVNGDTVVCDVARESNATLYCTGTFSTVNCAFEASIDGGTSWFGIQAARTNANTVESSTGNLSAAPAYAWELSCNAYTHIRVRATAFTSGTQVWTILPGAYATEPAPAIQTHAVTGSGNFAITMAANATTTPAKARDVAAGANDTGIPAWFVRRDTPTALTPAAGDWETAQIDSMGSLWVREKSSTTSALTSVAGSASSVTVLALNAQRRGATIYNDSTAILYLKLGATASTTSFTVKMQPDSYYEVPALYTGVIDGIWASATGNARVTEISA